MIRQKLGRNAWFPRPAPPTIGIDELQYRESLGAVIADPMPEIGAILMGRYSTKRTSKAFEKRVRRLTSGDGSSAPDGFTNIIDELVGGLRGQPEDNDLRVTEGSVKADGVREKRTVGLSRDLHDRPAVIRNY